MNEKEIKKIVCDLADKLIDVIQTELNEHLRKNKTGIAPKDLAILNANLAANLTLSLFKNTMEQCDFSPSLMCSLFDGYLEGLGNAKLMFMAH